MQKAQTPPQEWTPESVKMMRPSVKVKVTPDKPHKADTVDGMIRGDQESFALISIKWYGVTVSFQAAWSTVANCLNGNRPILY